MDRLFDRQDCRLALEQHGLSGWSQHVQQLCQARLTPAAHGDMPRWIDAWNRLPQVADCQWSANSAAVTVTGTCEASPAQVSEVLRAFHPWRKGPFHVFGVDIDSEWRSNLKWERIAPAVDFRDKTVIDVGCGNGYYGWRMADAGASLVLGCDPYPLYWMQYEVLRRYAPPPLQHWVVPLSDADLPSNMEQFDVVCSMGVLYHSHYPQEHLRGLWEALASGGQLVLETLIIDDPRATALEPSGRYAKMKNVRTIPSLPLLSQWLAETGLRDIEIIDISPTTHDEQRRTPWMTFESLADFLDPHTPQRTIEGHPAPVRAILTARRP